MSHNEQRCDKCLFWSKSEENPNIGECRVNAPIPYTSIGEDGETLEIHAMWPAPEAHEFCFQFVKKEKESNKEKFSTNEFIKWMNSNLDGDYVIDLYPSEDGLGICGKISSPYEILIPEKDLVEYLEQFFAPEDIDVSFT